MGRRRGQLRRRKFRGVFDVAEVSLVSTRVEGTISFRGPPVPG